MRITDIEDDDHEYKTIPTSQLAAITSPSTYNGRSDLTPECGHIENQERSQRRFTSQHSYDYLYLIHYSSEEYLRTWISLRM